VDSGSTLTVASTILAERLASETKPANFEAVCFSGNRVRIVAKMPTKMEIGKCSVNGPVYLVNDDQSNKKDYQIILGNDFLIKLPPITFDHQKGNIILAGHKIKMISPNWLDYSCQIRAIDHTILNPGTQTIVTVKMENTFPKETPILVEYLDQRLVEENISTIPTVIKNSQEFKIILNNPNNYPKSLHKGMSIAYGGKLEATASPHIFSLNCNNLRESSKVIIDPKFKIDYSKCSIIGNDLDQLKSLCGEFGDIFSKSQYDLGSCTAGEHDIVTTTEDPIASKPHRTPFKYNDELHKHIDQLLASGVMIESDTPWVSNIVLVQKKDGGLRPCIDFRKLNEVTIPDHYPLPRLETIMERVGSCHYYSSLDLSSGYLQIKLSERASRKCGVITEDKIYQMINLPFGLRNATSAFSRCMAHVLSGLEESVVVYVDDILIFTKENSFDLHLSALKKVFERFRRFNLKLSPKKCIFAAATMNFLGFTIGPEGYTPSLSKVEVIKDLPIPTNVRGIKHVVGMASFFRKHVPNFSTIVEPLTRLTRKEGKFEWGEEQDEAFTKVKQILSEKPVLIFPNYDKVFHIFTDASNVGQGGALMQYNEELSVYQAIAYCSRTMSASERKWPAVQAELGAIIYALRQFKPYIFMAEIELHCDHKPLAYLLKKADAHPNLARWLIELQNYNIKIVHIAGKHNLLADALSRFPHENATAKFVEDLSELEDLAEFPICLSLNLKPRVAHESSVLNLMMRDGEGKLFSIDIREEQASDEHTKALIQFLNDGKMPEGANENDADEIASQAEFLTLTDNVLYFRPPSLNARIFIPISLRPIIFEAFHTSPISGGHLNVKKTLKKCKKYYWPRMHADIVIWTRQCVTCQLRHNPNPTFRAEMQMPPANTLFAKVALDLAGPFPTSSQGNKHLLNMICCFTKYVISVPIPDAKATTIARAFLNHCYLRFGGCTSLLTDNATAFTSDFFRNFCSFLYIDKCYAIPHWSQGNAIVERSFRTFHNIIAKYISKDEPNFDEHLNAANFCYNTSIHSSTNETPFFLVFGRDPIFSIDQILDPKASEPTPLTSENDFKQRLVKSLRLAWESAAAINKESQIAAKAHYDKLTRKLDIQVGDRVLLRNYAGKVGTSRKFHLPWKGVFRVIEINGVLITILSCSAPQTNPRIVHINQLKKCFESLGPPCTTRQIPPEEKLALDEIRAEEILDKPGFSHPQTKQIVEKQAIEEETIEEPIIHPFTPSDHEKTLIKARGENTKYSLRERPKKKNFDF
jgi:hypothetical protein